VGRHAADRGSSPHPLVAAALVGHPRGQGPRHLGVKGAVGWPGPASAEGGGLGWPRDATGGADGDGEDPEEPAPPVRAV
jgi:hypothetical protein